MNTLEFKDFAKATIDFIADYHDNIRDVTVLPDVKPGFLIEALPKQMPQTSEKWQDVLKDVKQYIMPGMTHWNSPYFHAYYPSGTSYPSIVAEMLSSAINVIGFSWITSPVCTELEMIMSDWLARLMHLPEEFLFSSDKDGGGIIQGSASECIFVCLLVAKHYATRRVQNLHPEWDEDKIRSKLVAYSSVEANCSVEKAGLLGSVLMRLLSTDDNHSLRGKTLEEAIEKDLEKGLIPFYVVATIGTTNTCSLDNLEELGPICRKYNIWLHIDAAYAGAASICPEYRYLLAGVEYADSINVNLHKWLLVNFDAAIMWVKDSKRLIEAFNVDGFYLPKKKNVVPDYRHWQISLGRRFRSLKLWFVFRIYGVEGLQRHIRNTIKLADVLEEYVRSDDRFELLTKKLTVVCFHFKGNNLMEGNNLTRKLIDRLQTRRQIYIINGLYNDKLCIRFVVCSQLCTEEDIAISWNEISSQATEILQEKQKENNNII